MIFDIFVLYMAVAWFVCLGGILDMSTSSDLTWRRAVFWPLYAIRWLVVNLLLAFKGQ